MAKGLPARKPGLRKTSKRSPQVLGKSSMRDVSVRTSTLRGAGKGLFAARDFPKATLLPAPYRGRRLTFAQFQRLKDFRWCFEVREGPCWAVDAKALTRGNPLRYVNGVKLEDGRAWFVTTRAVNVGEEFFIDYGPGYWRAYENCWGRPHRLRARIRDLRNEIRRLGAFGSSKRKRLVLQEALEDAEDELEELGLL
mmetsp:Transcript_55785/g.129933  ORF Transcript_55785/g.129933 Transcript_55785/m.129933 type:complete len:196 (+) Transcript_55785:46-633(+)